jgi:uncharacterized protein YcnI
VTVSPARVEAGERLLTFTVPNELFEGARVSRIEKVAIKAPPGVRLRQSQTKAGWSGAIRGRTMTWSGGPISYGEYDTFGVVVEVPAGSLQLVFEALEYFDPPRSQVERFPVRLSVESTSTSSSGHGLAVAALIVAVSTGALALAAFFIGSTRWLRGG